MPIHENSLPETNESPLTLEHAVFHGLSARKATFSGKPETSGQQLKKTLMGSIPLLMTGTLATGVIATPGALAQPADSGDRGDAGSERLDHRPGIAQRLHHALLPVAHAVLSQVRSDLPATYTVQAGDSVSSVADRFGIPTPAILTLNGLSWNTVLQQGQVLKLSAEPTKKRASSPARVAAAGYIVQYGDSVSVIADRLGISTAALLAHNNLEANAAIYPGQVLTVPGATKPTISRDLPGRIPVLASAPSVVPAGLANAEEPQDSAQDAGEDSEKPKKLFDAADMPLAEKQIVIAPKVTKPPPAKPKAVVQAPQPKPAPTQPAAAPAPSTTVGQPITGTITPLNDERRANAQIIVAVGRELGVPDYGIVIALATAMQESSLRNINWGDRDSLGLFQQRPSTGWGSPEQIMDPAYATRLFFGGPSNPNAGRTRGLLDIAGWQNMALTDAAQRVQISAYPLAYAKWEASAWAWLYELS